MSVVPEHKTYHPTRCKKCRSVLIERHDLGWTVFCRCYDPHAEPPDEENIRSSSYSRNGAVYAWNERWSV